MTGKQLSIYLSEIEIRSLTDLAIKQCRRPNEQARYIIRQALGLIQEENPRANTGCGERLTTSDITGASADSPPDALSS